MFLSDNDPLFGVSQKDDSILSLAELLSYASRFIRQFPLRFLSRLKMEKENSFPLPFSAAFTIPILTIT
ncbi:hypothetical protein LEP1GSC048_2971 [Leptospira santarosai serovar Shermani str. 1342KT]|nr:hypothetical protein LEP1GSC048_2971 [Leptospira santarosai serovar Shermani str. 1342KT]